MKITKQQLKQIIREELTRDEEAEAMERDLKPRVFDGEMVDSYARNPRPSPEEIEEEAKDIEERAAIRQQFVTPENYRWIVWAADPQKFDYYYKSWFMEGDESFRRTYGGWQPEDYAELANLLGISPDRTR